MSGSKTELVLDLGELTALQGQLASAHASMQGLNNTAGSIADQVGHAGLAGRVHDFASSWETHRGNIVQSLATLRGQLGTVVEGIQQADSGLATGLTSGSNA